MAKSWMERILILAKTYPSPSAAYVETSCVAGINEHGDMRRLYPVPFRLLEQGQQFKKWQWIDVRVEKTRKDHRKESHKIYVDQLTCGPKIDTNRDKEWKARLEWLGKVPTFQSFDELDKTRTSHGHSLALLQPKRVLSLEITKSRNADWTEEEKEKLTRSQTQGDLFTESFAREQVAQLQKLPYDFYYRYVCDTPVGEREYRHKIVDWEAGALYRNCLQRHGTNWQTPFRQKLERDLTNRSLTFLMGNQHRFQDQWLIISLVYPPRRSATEPEQTSMF